MFISLAYSISVSCCCWSIYITESLADIIAQTHFKITILYCLHLCKSLHNICKYCGFTSLVCNKDVFHSVI